MSLPKLLYRTSLFQKAITLEEDLALREGVIRYTDISPRRFDIIRGRLESSEAVFTSIQDLPFREGNHHQWVRDFCENCRICHKECPAGAFHDHPILHPDGKETYVRNDECFPYFNKFHGCSVCVKVCPFNQQPYEKIRASLKH